MRRPRAFAAGACAALAVTAMVGLSPRASARPVPVGRFVRIPYGVSHAHPWPAPDGGPERRRRSAFEAPRAQPTLRWQTRVGTARAFAPAVTEDGMIYVASASALAAVTPAGEVAWSLPLNRPLAGPAVTPEGHLVLSASRTELLTVDRGGRVRAHASVGAHPLGGPLVLADGSLVVVALDHAVHRFDAEGRLVFRTRVPSTVRGEPALDARGRLLVPTATELASFDVDGRPLRNDAIAVDTLGGPTVADDGVVWLLGRRGELLAVESDGRVAERANLQTNLSASNRLAVGNDGALRVTANSGGVVCVGPSGGARWRHEGESTFPGPLTLDARDTTLAIDGTGRMHAIDAEGNLLWSVSVGSMSEAPVIARDGTIYVATSRGTLQAWR